jgi:uncharacterized phage protein (TIGR02220 family)
MKFTILGYSQIKLIEFGMDTMDALLLRYFIDFKDSKAMIKEKIGEDTFYWLKYDGIVRELPILKLKSDSIYRRLKNMCKINVLKHKTLEKNGTYSYFAIGENYIKLISELNPMPSDSNPVPSGFSSSHPSDLNPEQKINLLDNNSIKYINKYKVILEYLNKKAETKYTFTAKKTQQLIKTRLKDGFTVEDFYMVIDNNVSEWLNTDMEKYLRPETLFGPKFEGYLNQKPKGLTQSYISERDYKKLQSEGVGFSV